MLATRLRGIVPPLVTPLAAQDRLDHAGLERLVEHVLEANVSGLFILGTTGEGPSLSRARKVEVIRAVAKQVAGRTPVLTGIIDTSYEESLALAHAAADAGTAAVVIAPPPYFHIEQRDLLTYLERLGKDAPLPVVLYNIPSLTKTVIEPETVRMASTMDGIAALKDSSGDLDYLAAVMRSVPADFPVLIGPEEMLAEGIRMGAWGGVCGGANLNPKLLVDLYRTAASGAWAEAEQLQTKVRRIAATLCSIGESTGGYLRGLKCALAAKGICSGELAFPYSPFTPAEYARALCQLQELDRV